MVSSYSVHVHLEVSEDKWLPMVGKRTYSAKRMPHHLTHDSLKQLALIPKDLVEAD